MKPIPSTIFWKGNQSYDVWLSEEDTRKLVETFINATADVVNVVMYPDGQPGGFNMHIDVQEIKAIVEGYVKPKRR